MTYKTYHVFTNELDEWFDDKKDAVELYNEWKKEYGTARLYEEIREKSSDEVIDENCIKSFGEWPL